MKNELQLHTVKELEQRLSLKVSNETTSESGFLSANASGFLSANASGFLSANASGFLTV